MSTLTNFITALQQEAQIVETTLKKGFVHSDPTVQIAFNLNNHKTLATVTLTCSVDGVSYKVRKHNGQTLYFDLTEELIAYLEG